MTMAPAEVPGRASPTPQAYIFTMLERHLQGRSLLVSSATVIDTMRRLGVSERVTRLTLARMVERSYLERHRRGRRTYFATTDRCARVLGVNESRVREAQARRARLAEVADHNTWTLLSFSIPETRRRDRRAFRVKLAWSGFGALRDGVWIAAGERDVSDIVEELDLRGCIDLFVGAMRVPDPHEMVSRVWKLDELRAGYDAFLARWEGTELPSDALDPLGAEILLVTEWRQLVRAYPDVPFGYLPGDWPVARCEEVLHRRLQELQQPATALFAEILDALPAGRRRRSY
jgi:phenylacetic acid degradation operon negative regulatory protein